MANVTLGQQGVDMSTLTFAPIAQVLDNSATRYRVRYTTGNTLDYGGSFQYSVSGGGGYYDYGGGSSDISGGTISSLEYTFSDSQMAYHADNLSMDLGNFSLYYTRNDYEAMLAEAFQANDTMQGGAGGDKIEGFAGNDQIDGDAVGAAGGNDTIFGGDGNDFIRGLDGNDQVYGGNGADDINGNQGQDT